MDVDTVVHSNCKHPSSYVPYRWTLTDKLKKTAKSELREDENVREQSLAQMRDWIAKSAHIKRCRTDPLFLLRFLRTKKFSVPQACEMLEKYLTIRQTAAHMFSKCDIEDPEIEAIIDGGYIVPLPKRDSNGYQIVLSVAGNLDLDKVNSSLLARTHFMVQEVLADDEQSQICGYRKVTDEREITMKLLGMWSIIDIKRVAECIQNALPMRLKSIDFIGLPSTMASFAEFCISLLRPKMQKRVSVSKMIEYIFKYQLLFALITLIISVSHFAVLSHLQGLRVQNGQEHPAERARRHRRTASRYGGRVQGALPKEARPAAGHGRDAHRSPQVVPVCDGFVPGRSRRRHDWQLPKAGGRLDRRRQRGDTHGEGHSKRTFIVAFFW